MKSVIKFFLVLGHILLFQTIDVFGQLYSENFASGMPPAWIQSPLNTWSISTTLGTGNSNCAITEELNTTTVTNVISTGTIPFGTFANPTISFSLATVKNNFIAPNLALYYDTGNGKQFVARWGSGFSPNTTYTIADGFDPLPPLDYSNVYWTSCSHSFATSANTIRLIFEAELVNAGYVLIDNVKLNAQPFDPLAVSQSTGPECTIYPSPFEDELVICGNHSFITLSNVVGQTFPLQACKNEKGRSCFNCAELAPGIYFVELPDGRRTSLIKN